MRHTEPRRVIQLGLNFLDLHRYDALGFLPHNQVGLWSDNAEIYENHPSKQADAKYFNQLRREYHHNGIYFGGVAFKYQKPVSDFAKVAEMAVPYVDVVTTSGIKTGHQADLQKVVEMREAIGNHPLAIASGITPENVSQYMDYADCFLVATGVSHPDTDELDPRRVFRLARLLSA